MTILRYYHTLKYLRGDQLFHRILYSLKLRLYPIKPYRINTFIDFRLPSTVTHFPLKQGKYLGGNKFRLLNIEHDFQSHIDWTYDEYGMLWTFQLNYFDFLLDESCSQVDAVRLMDDWCNAEPRLTVGKMAYPISLRTINWIKVMIRFGMAKPRHIAVIRCELDRLMKNIEFHVLGNHLLENAFALVFCGISLNEPKWINKGLQILEREIPEQFLQDGGHFERSPMYHKILLEKVLDILNIVGTSNIHQVIVNKLEPLAQKMMSWLLNMTFPNNEVPDFNDSVSGVSMTTSELKEYYSRLGIQSEYLGSKLSQSGYRRLEEGPFVCILDAGDVGPDYLLAHAHSDTLSFCLMVCGHMIIVDTGTSTYEIGERRQLERSTSAHNTVTISDLDQSDSWAAFRMARRAHSKILKDEENVIHATHDGYKIIDSAHNRFFSLTKNRLEIKDYVTGGKNHRAYFHLHHTVTPEIKSQEIHLLPSLKISFEGAQSIRIEKFKLAIGMNNLVDSNKIVVEFNSFLKTDFIYT
jgi:uncharacterized heparinase superfamily protein